MRRRSWHRAERREVRKLIIPKYSPHALGLSKFYTVNLKRYNLIRLMTVLAIFGRSKGHDDKVYSLITPTSAARLVLTRRCLGLL